MGKLTTDCGGEGERRAGEGGLEGGLATRGALDTGSPHWGSGASKRVQHVAFPPSQPPLQRWRRSWSRLDVPKLTST